MNVPKDIEPTMVRRQEKRVVHVRKKKKPPPTLTRTGKRAKKRGRKPDPEKELRKQQALELRASGVTYRDIAEKLGYSSPSHAKYDVDKAISDVHMDAAKEVVMMDLTMLDEFKMRLLHDLRNNGNLHQIDRIFRVMEWKYRLLGVSDETVRQMQDQFGIAGTPSVVNNTNNVQVVMASPETEDEFIGKMMRAVGIDDSSEVAKKYIEERSGDKARTPPMLVGSVNEAKQVADKSDPVDGDDIVDAEIVE